MAATHSIPNILWEAARDKDIPDTRDDSCWPILRMVLKRDSIIETRSPEQWLKSFDRIRRLMRKEEKIADSERSISTDSGYSEARSELDSGYNSYSATHTEFTDQKPRDLDVIHALSERPEEHNNNKQVPLVGCYSDETDENYIIETACERLGLKLDKDRKVTVTWIQYERGKGSKFSRTKCAVWPDGDGLADIVFTTRVEKKILSSLNDEELSEDTDTETENPANSKKYKDKNARNADGFDSACELDDQCSVWTGDRKGRKQTSLTQSLTFSERQSEAMSGADSGYDTWAEREKEPPAQPQPAQPLASGSKRRTARIDDASYISAFVKPSEHYKDGVMPLGVHYSGRLDEDCISKSVFSRLGLGKGRDGKVLIPWAPRSGGKTQLSNFAIRPDSEMIADVEMTSKALKGKEEIEKEKHVQTTREPRGSCEDWHIKETLKQRLQPEDQFSPRNPLGGLCINISLPQNTPEAVDRATPEMKEVVSLLQKHLKDTKKLRAQASGDEASPFSVQCALKEVISSEAFLNSIAANVTALLKPLIAEELDTIQPLIEAVFSHDSMLRKIDRSVEGILVRLDSNAQGRQKGQIASWEEEVTENNVLPTKGVEKLAEVQPEASGTQTDAKQLNSGPDENDLREIADANTDVRESISKKEHQEGERGTSLELCSQLREESTQCAEDDHSLRETRGRPSSPTSNNSQDNSMIMSLHSSTNSAYSEDSTDWEGDSDEECSVESPLLTRERLESRMRHYQRTMVDNKLTPTNADLVESLISDQTWQDSSRKCGSGAASTSGSRSGSGSGSPTSQLDKPSVATTKRSRDNGDDETQEDGSGRGFKRSQRPSKRPDDLEGGRPFACPFRKHNPGKYSAIEWRTCALTAYKTVTRLKAHLYTKHSIHWCQRCKGVFDTEKALDIHIEAPIPCESRVSEPVEGITRKMKAELQCKRKDHPGQTGTESWTKIYKLLFPNDKVIPTPYFEPVYDAQAVSQLPHSRVLADYNTYLQHVLPQLINMEFETVNDEIQLVEERSKTKLIKVVEKALTRAFTNYYQFQALHETILDAESTSNVSFKRSAMTRIIGDKLVPDFLQTFGPVPPLSETPASLDPSYFRMTQRGRDGSGQSESSFSNNRSASSSGLWQGSEFAAVSSNTTTASSMAEVQIAEINRMNQPSKICPASIGDLEMLSLPLRQSEHMPAHTSGLPKENQDEQGAKLHLLDSCAADEGVQTSSQDYTSTEEMMWPQEHFPPQIDLDGFDSVDWDALLNPRMDTNDTDF